MTEAVNILIKADDKASEKFAAVAANADKAGQKTNAAFQASARTAKTTVDFGKALASFSGSDELGGIAQLAGMLADATEKASAFSDVANKGGAGALAFKLGLAGLAATAGGIVGKALGDLIFQTKAAERELARAGEASVKLNEEMAKLSAKGFANELEDIELIRDPAEKRAAIAGLLDRTEKDVAAVTAAIKISQAEVDKWADSWIKFTDTQKEAEREAQRALESDKQRLDRLKEQRDAVREMGSERTRQIEAIKAANAAADEQEREAIRAKAEALRDAESARQKLADDAARAAEKAQEDAAREVQRVEDLIAAEQERLALQRIELEQGKEIARVHELVGRGVEESIAKQLAAEETAIEALRRRKAEEDKPKTEEEKKVSAATNLMASQSRLTTRGQSNPMDETNKLLEQAQKHAEQLAKFNEQQLEQQKMIAQNTANTLTVRPTT